MAAKRGCIALQLALFLICSSFASTVFGATNDTSPPLNRTSFPEGFVFGSSSSAYQYEGAASLYGRGPSIWDTFAHDFPERIADRSTGDVAVDFYHRYKDDVKLMKDIGLDAFRMSISWSRILPRGNLSGGVNQEGIDFYNNVINELLANGITPFVTIFHWDLPQGLEDEYLGFLSPRILDDYKDFAELCFKEFGDRVKHWATLNEPYIFASGGYDGGLTGNAAPGRCSNRAICTAGDSATEPYIVGHNLLLAHATAVKLYREKYQAIQKGDIGIVLISHWFVPYSSSRLDVRAAQRALDFMYGWFIHPIVYGDYPRTMRTIVGDRLPKFTKEEAELVKGSFDYVGLNYYTGNFARHVVSSGGNVSSATDNKASLSTVANGVSIGIPTAVSYFDDYPKGLHDLLVYTKERYNNPTIYITETGMTDGNNITKYAIDDDGRINFYNGHIRAVHRAIEQGVDVKGFFAWSLLDNFEWGSGYTQRFGIIYIDYQNNLTRILKESANWFKSFLSAK
ncbi:UNVERIFIED_CONTAM: Beta-glucosidase 12 [Sesamum radiatum]|uniref:Beta-glucosidase 12 n=1 Tax=Sesamum radiatum TaxID=300843 RepID=A0AAW2R1G3_SESRA